MATTGRLYLSILAYLLLVLVLPADAGLLDLFTRGERPPRDYLILINYELGMHCTGFDFTYCCVLPPYNSILAQVVKTERKGKRPELLAADPEDPEVLVDGERRFKLAYTHEDPRGVPNTYSASKKLAYWGVRHKGAPLPDHYFSSLYLYKDLEGSNPEGTTADAKKLHVGIDTPIKFNQGPTGQHVGHGYLRYSGDTGTVVYTDSPAMENVPIKLTNPGIWEALGLPLTPFNDLFTALTTLDETMVQPFMKSVVTLVDAETDEPVIDSSGQVVRFFGVNPIDVPNCARCHSNETANGTRYQKYKEEYAFWREIRRSGEWYAQLKAAAVSILEIHDDHHGTNFLAKWPAGPQTYLRFGRSTVLCQDCHADNVIGRLSSRKAGAMDGEDVQAGHPNLPAADHLISPLTEAIHKVHQRNNPLPDSQGFAGGCQLCHPSHRSDQTMDDFPITADGRNHFAEGDIRDAKGCFTGRDVHANPNRHHGAGTASYLNAVGNYLLGEVMDVDGEDKGLYCTHCHNRLSRELYKGDHLQDAVAQTGKTLRDKELPEIAAALGVSEVELIRNYLDPRSPMEGEDTTSGVYRTWERSGQTIAPIAKIKLGSDSKPLLTEADVDGDRSVVIASIDPLDDTPGLAVPYDAATHGRDYWLAPGEPHCADCHQPPFVESMGGGAFPIDQPGKYALMRYSKGHAGITCQGCHESIHGLYPVDPAVDITAYRQAAMLNSDGSHGPIKCGACHRVNDHGVPARHRDKIDKKGPYWNDYEKAVELQHTLRAHE